MSKGSKLTAIVLLAVVVVGGLGYWLLAPRMPSGLVTYTTQETSLLTSSEQTTHSTSTLSIAVTSKTKLWINVTATKPVSYYLSLLKSTGTQPYVQLAWELQALPDATNATAIAKITYLALNATNPEVEEAFELMIKGGTPDPKDFAYPVQRYNTELQVLYWLACQNEFKTEDTLVLAIAMVNGLWITIGDKSVRQDVGNDTGQLLRFLRETNEIQLKRGNIPLEDYPLEAKICLAYTSSIGTIDGPHSLWKFVEKRASRKDYRWVRYDVDVLRKMRGIAFEKGWFEESVDSTARNVEDYFYFSGFAEHWTYSTRTGDIPGVTESLIEVYGELMPDHSIYNLQFYLEQYLSKGRGVGDCGDETYFMEAWTKSLGIATNFVLHQIILDGKFYGHAHMIYYEPATKTWKAYAEQLAYKMYYNKPDLPFYVFIFRPPVRQAGYFKLSPIRDTRFGYSGTAYVHPTRQTPAEFRSIYLTGCATSQMKQWLLLASSSCLALAWSFVSISNASSTRHRIVR